MTSPNTEVLTRIYGSILSAYMEPFAESVRDAASHITAATLQLYAGVVDKLPPTPSKFHYIFTLRDLVSSSGGGGMQCVDACTVGRVRG
jgi:dynein heavy chain, axonemal